MSNLKNLAVIAPLGSLIFVAYVDCGRADELDSRLLGAWVQSSSDCKQIFETRDGRLVYRQPIDAFSTAFIIGPNEIHATTGSCRVGRVSNAKDYISIALECDNSVGFLPLKARVTIRSSTEITYGDAANDPVLDATYEKCSP
jgi:hypothetical protein